MKTPRHSILILSKDSLFLIKQCLESLAKHVDHSTTEILVGDTGTQLDSVWHYYHNYSGRFPHLMKVHPLGQYHFSRNNNALAHYARGRTLTFLNNDTLATAGWVAPIIESLKKHAIVGSKLLYHNTGRIQHAGIEFQTRQKAIVAYHPYQGRRPNLPEATRNKIVPAITGACLSLSATDFEKLGGFDPLYEEECQDVDLCLNARKTLERNCFYDARSVLYHFENGTRRKAENEKDRRRLTERWSKFVHEHYLSQRFQSQPVPKPSHRTYVLFHRTGARGDVFASTAVVRKFRKAHPKTHISYKTSYPELIDGLPEIDRVLHEQDYDDYHYDQIHELRYEAGPWRTQPHPWLDAMASTLDLQLKTQKERIPSIQFTSWDEPIREFYRRQSRRHPYVVIATTAGVPDRNWNDLQWKGLTKKLKKEQWRCFQIGSFQDAPIEGAHALLGRDLYENLAILESARALITVDSFPYHLGLAIGLPTLLLTCKSSHHTLWVPKQVQELRHTQATHTPLPGCRLVGCRSKEGEGHDRLCDHPILHQLPATQVWKTLQPLLNQ